MASSVSLTNFSCRIGQQGKRQLILPGESSVRFHRIPADPQDLGAMCFKLTDSITESNTFGYSARCVCFRVKPKNDCLSFVVA